MKKGLTKSYIIEYMDAMEITTADHVMQNSVDIYDWCMLHKDELGLNGLTYETFLLFLQGAYSNHLLFKQFTGMSYV